LGRFVVVITGGVGVVTVIERDWPAVVPPAETCTVKTLVPPVVGVPEMMPVEGFKLRPVGNAPEIDQM